MKGLFKTIMYSMCITLVFQGCSEDSDSTTGSVVDNTITTPATYEFASRFNDGESSVSFTGQVVRIVVIKDLKSLAKSSSFVTIEPPSIVVR